MRMIVSDHRTRRCGLRLRVAIVVVAVCGTASIASAYPIFQLSTGTDRCVTCHHSPSGGGLINDYGRSEAGDTIAGRRGDGSFLHGLWTPPGWLGLGGDVRTAGLVLAHQLDRPGDDQAEFAVFPMQMDLYARFGFGDFSFNVTAGVRGSARAANGDMPSLLSRLGSREHYVQWENANGTLYARLGRYYPTFGLRLQDHTAFVRRFLGAYLLEEPYALSLTEFGASWEVHLAVFVPSPIPRTSAGERGSGVSAYVEKRLLSDRVAVGGQTRASLSSLSRTFTVGGVGKAWLPGTRLLLLGELDVQLQRFGDQAATHRWQVASYLGATKPLGKRWWATLATHMWDPDLTLRGTLRSAAEIAVQYFPYAHFELQLLGRVSATGTSLENPSTLAMLQAHYFL